MYQFTARIVGVLLSCLWGDFSQLLGLHFIYTFQKRSLHICFTFSPALVAGKISRRVSLVHYPEPEELEKLEAEKKSKRLYQMSARSSLISSSHHSVTPIQSTKLGNSHSSRGHSALTHSSRHNDSSLFDVDEQSNPRKRRRDHKPNFSEDGSTLDSGRGYSRYTFSGTSEHTQQWKLKVEVKGEE
uniref:Uncharacterized protein MANES_08G100300 n=1 Tax=Rhizophora mucronata TaxID=61149 RepID=A0A2P2JLG3_RHIMU